MNNPTRTITSRRARPAKEPLSKELIVKTALALMKNEGMSGFSMRKVAKVLDTGPSSLYVYVKNLQELSAYVLDYGLDKVLLSEAEDELWNKRLLDTLDSYLTILYESPGLAELSLTTIPIGPNSLAITEYILQRLHEGGVHSKSAAWGVDMLLLYASSIAFEQASRNQRGHSLQAVRASYQSLDSVRYPMLTELRDVMFTGGRERFHWVLEVMIQGMLHNQD